MADKDSIKARIRALRAKTVENGCTEAEALAAAEKLMELLAKHGLRPGEEEIAEEDVTFRRTSPSPLQPLFGVIAEVCHCKAVLLGLRGEGVRYVGRDPWPEAAAYLHAVVSAAAARAMRDFRDSAAYRRHYRLAAKQVAEHHYLSGFMNELARKLRALKKARNEGEEQRRDLAMAAQALERMQTRPVMERGARRAEHFADAARAGVRAGENTNIAWGVGKSRDTARVGSM